VLFTFKVSKRYNNFATAAISDTLKIALLYSSDSNAVVLDEILKSKIIDTS
jgi:hypothetical protein